MGLIIQDTFSGATQNLTAHSPDVNVPGGAYVDFNFIPALKTDGSGNCITVSTHGTTIQGDVLQNSGAGIISDYKAQIQVTVPNQASVGTYQMAAGLIVRLQTGSGGGNFWLVAIENDANTVNGYYVRLALVTGGSVITNQILASGLSLNNSQHTLAVSMTGNVYTLSLDATTYTPYTDVSNTYTTAKAVGPLIVNGGGYAGASLQNFEVDTVPLVINQTSLPNARFNASYLQTITSTGGYQPTVTYAVTSGTLPTGLTLNASTGVISGAPTVSGNFFFTITASDTLFDSGSQAFTLLVSGKPFLVTPDPRAQSRTRRFQQGVAEILNGLSLGGFLTMTPGGGFKVGGVVIGDVVSGGHYAYDGGVTQFGGDVLFVGQGPVLAQDDNLAFLPTSAGGPILTVNGGSIANPGGTISCSTVIVSSSVVINGFMSLQSLLGGEAGFFEAFNDPAPASNSSFVIWAADYGSPTFPGHIFGILPLGSGYTPVAAMGLMAGGTLSGFTGGPTIFATCTYYLVGLSTSGGAPYTFSFDASGNLACASGTLKSTSADALAVGANGTSNPVLQVDASAATVKTGIAITGAAAGAGVNIGVISSAASESLTITSKGTGTVQIGGIGNYSGSGYTINQIGQPTAFQVISSVGTNSTGLQVNTSSASALVALNALSGGAGPANVSINVNGKGTGAVNIKGTGTNNSAGAGVVGEFVSSAIAVGAAVALTTATSANVTSISLTAGDWDVDGNINFTTATATFTATQGGISSTSATLPTDGTEVYSGLIGTLVSDTDSVTLPRKRISIASTTTVYLVAQMTFSAGTASAFGSISARRVR